MVIPELDDILRGSPYEDKLENYKLFFRQSKIVTIQDLENCPRYAGPNLCGHSTYEFIAFVREATLNPPEPEPEPAPKPKIRKSKKKVTVEPEPEPEVVEEEAVINEEEDAQNSEKE